jgi:hypothetical protein
VEEPTEPVGSVSQTHHFHALTHATFFFLDHVVYCVIEDRDVHD